MRLELDLAPEDRKLFLDEVEEQLQLLDEDLIRLEKEGDNAGLLQEIFRAAHTLKGSSATIGHHRMAHLTHAMETLFDKLRQRELTTDRPIVDALLESLDTLRVLKDEVVALETSDVDVALLIRRLERVRQGAGEMADAGVAEVAPPVSLPSAASEPVAAAPLGHPAYDIEIGLNKDSGFNAVRSWQAISQLAELGEVLSSVPSLVEIEREQVGDSLHITFAGPVAAGEIESALAEIPDIASVNVKPWQPTANIGDERRQNESATVGRERRIIDLGIEARGKSAAEQLQLAAHKISQLTKTVRIDVERLDTLMNLVGELVIDQVRLQRIGTNLEEGHRDDSLVATLTETCHHIGRISDQLQEHVMKARLLPIETVFNKLPRVARDLAVKSGKQVDLVIEGNETELDRSVIEEIGDPLIHILRNAVDHGIESPAERSAVGKLATGAIRLVAKHEEGHIVITIEDDGRGIDGEAVKQAMLDKGLLSWEEAQKLGPTEAVNLIFTPGVSTAKQVTDISGRGVGMDIVKTNVEKLGGTVEIETLIGQGTRFVIKLPLTLAILQALMVSSDGNTYAIPLSTVIEIVRVQREAVKSVVGKDVIVHRGNVLPLLRMQDVFHGRHAWSDAKDHEYVVVAKHGQRRTGLVVDSLVGQQQIVVKKLGRFVDGAEGIAGATILDDGRVGLIVDVPSLIRELTAA